jgi:hypothetical protein
MGLFDLFKQRQEPDPLDTTLNSSEFKSLIMEDVFQDRTKVQELKNFIREIVPKLEPYFRVVEDLPSLIALRQSASNLPASVSLDSFWNEFLSTMVQAAGPNFNATTDLPLLLNSYVDLKQIESKWDWYSIPTGAIEKSIANLLLFAKRLPDFVIDRDLPPLVKIADVTAERNYKILKANYRIWEKGCIARGIDIESRKNELLFVNFTYVSQIIVFTRDLPSIIKQICKRSPIYKALPLLAELCEIDKNSEKDASYHILNHGLPEICKAYNNFELEKDLPAIVQFCKIIAEYDITTYSTAAEVLNSVADNIKEVGKAFILSRDLPLFAEFNRSVKLKLREAGHSYYSEYSTLANFVAAVDSRFDPIKDLPVLEKAVIHIYTNEAYRGYSREDFFKIPTIVLSNLIREKGPRFDVQTDLLDLVIKELPKAAADYISNTNLTNEFISSNRSLESEWCGEYSSSFYRLTLLGQKHEEFIRLHNFYSSSRNISQIVDDRFDRQSKLLFYFREIYVWDRVQKVGKEEKVLNFDAISREIHADILSMKDSQDQLSLWSKGNDRPTLAESLMTKECFNNIKRLGKQFGIDIPSFILAPDGIKTEPIVNSRADEDWKSALVEELGFDKEDSRLLKLEVLIAYPTNLNEADQKFGLLARQLVSSVFEHYHLLGNMPIEEAFFEKEDAPLTLALAKDLSQKHAYEEFIIEVYTLAESLKKDGIELPNTPKDKYDLLINKIFLGGYPGALRAVYENTLKYCDQVARRMAYSNNAYLERAVSKHVGYPLFYEGIKDIFSKAGFQDLDRLLDYISRHIKENASEFIIQINDLFVRGCRDFVSKERHFFEAYPKLPPRAQEMNSTQINSLESKRREFIDKYQIKVTYPCQLEMCIPAGSNLYKFFRDANQLARGLYNTRLKLSLGFFLNWWEYHKTKEDIRINANMSPAAHQLVKDSRLAVMTDPVQISIAIASHFIATGDASLIEHISSSFGIALDTVDGSAREMNHNGAYHDRYHEGNYGRYLYYNSGVICIETNRVLSKLVPVLRGGHHREEDIYYPNVERDFITTTKPL